MGHFYFGGVGQFYFGANIYAQLRSPVVVEARAAAGHARSAPRSAFLAGGVLAVSLAVMLQVTFNGETAQEAKRLAAEQHGHDYSYFVSRINWSGGHVSALLTAYNEKETKEVVVEWDQQ